MYFRYYTSELLLKSYQVVHWFLSLSHGKPRLLDPLLESTCSSEHLHLRRLESIILILYIVFPNIAGTDISTTCTLGSLQTVRQPAPIIRAFLCLPCSTQIMSCSSLDQCQICSNSWTPGIFVWPMASPSAFPKQRLWSLAVAITHVCGRLLGSNVAAQPFIHVIGHAIP